MTKLSFSNIAWDVSEDHQVAALLNQYQCDAIDIAPGKYFPDVVNATTEQIKATASWWRERGISVAGMQSLLFGTQGLNLFDAVDVRQRMLNHLEAVCRIAAGLGATRLVFGSPKNRDRKSLSDHEVAATAVNFFRALGDIASDYSVIICLEPNPACYGANFMITTPETAEVVQAVNHPAVRMQFDTGAVTINNEDPFQLLAQYGELIGHIHISEPGLVPPGSGQGDHDRFSQAIRRHLSSEYATIEMLATNDQPHLQSIENALAFASPHYGATK
ncbi:sugar phosphate isomerase/epimerase family protein [Erwinia psidii]|uniref:Sugar phosphate isomerase/epimerase n=1 Tax=Erwinia psidii TaxID=69224 RepID=A0A3N6S2G0_9GAMM|nr:sugar phosphate isomerase/epimerase family protein [Erwinia psidii]MCX8956420.1 sugar phosphate isomerase/epimerase [Erwinia psidii]MCX8965811.1 sugar phosphate isomerase/epimerase [Erwinia psidii]RQM39754.1 sugar phosphate isomerase/epimerase [Erwinia psidii]